MCMSHKSDESFPPHGLDCPFLIFIIPVTSGKKFAEVNRMAVQVERQSSQIRSVLIINWISSRFIKGEDKLDGSLKLQQFSKPYPTL